MLKKFLPDQHVTDIFEITPASLKAKNIKGIITDLDNTLVAWNEPNATEAIREWFNQMAENGIKVSVVSNNDRKRVKHFTTPLNRPYIHRANKPLKGAFYKSLKAMQLKKEEVVVIGDQIMTDILGGNRAGFHTILVVPILQTDDKATKFNRKIERYILNKLEKRGWIEWQGKKN
ncbi:MAG: YqeG family HAD IIIA-type phosphatase [Bacillota bacterium]